MAMGYKSEKTKDKCFVIQPFNDDRYQKRYRDVFRPAIESAGLDPYRVDEDPGANVIITTIEEKIKSSVLCFAEITADNPNVWFELGYAMAINKRIVMVCEENRQLPFDIQHRRIIKYASQSPSDFDELKTQITKAIEAALDESTLVRKLSDPVNLPKSDQKPPHVLTVLVIVASRDQFDSGASHQEIRGEMHAAGFNDLAMRLALQELLEDGFVSLREEMSEFGPYSFYMVTKKAEQWLQENIGSLNLHHRPDTKADDSDEDIPF
ncbi:MAG: hypothetical protein OXC91_13915 [Rhodobacteraceae bacterium]|nr:hypothetical protein [Paracoccaceae bacterium]